MELLVGIDVLSRDDPLPLAGHPCSWPRQPPLPRRCREPSAHWATTRLRGCRVLVLVPTCVRRSIHDAVVCLCPHPQPDVFGVSEAGMDLKEAMCPGRINPSREDAGMRTPIPCDHPAPRRHSDDKGVVPTRISERVQPTDEPAVPFDLIVRLDDQREQPLLLLLPQVDCAQVKAGGGISGVVMIEEVGRRRRPYTKQEAT